MSALYAREKTRGSSTLKYRWSTVGVLLQLYFTALHLYSSCASLYSSCTPPVLQSTRVSLFFPCLYVTKKYEKHH